MFTDFFLLPAVSERVHEVCMFLLIPGHHLLHLFDSVQRLADLLIHQLLPFHRQT